MDDVIDENISDLPTRNRDQIYVLRRDPPQVHLTWASKFPRKVDKLKIRKRVEIFPVAITLKADYDTNTKEFEYGCSAKDVLFGGRISLNIPERQIEYTKRVGIPNAGQLVVTGNCTLRNNQITPHVGVQFEFGGDIHTSGLLGNGHTNAVFTSNAVDVRQRLTIVRGLGVEVCGAITLPMPTARYNYNSGMLAIGEGAFHFHVAEVNALLQI